jgi:hypothetical protein
MNLPRNFPWPANETANMRAGMQGQNFITVMEGSGPLSKVIIVMTAGKVSTVHAHKESDVYVDVLQADGRGALTLAGFNLEHEIWTPAGTTLHLPPRIPHVAVYPRRPKPPPPPPLDQVERIADSLDIPMEMITGGAEVDHWSAWRPLDIQGDLVAMETRCNPVADADIIPLTGYEQRLTERLRELDLLDRVTLTGGP